MKLKRLLLILMVSLLLLGIAGCTASTNTVEACVISNEQYSDKDTLESAAQPESLGAGEDAFASIYFIESPKGMEYTGTWYLDGVKLKTEQKEMTTEPSGVIVFSVEGNKIEAGTLKFEVSYGDDVLFSMEIAVK